MEQNGLCCGAKRRLREALLQMLEHTELDKICVTELCRLAEVNRTSFYRYYNLPGDVLQEFMEEFAAGMMQISRLPADSPEREKAVSFICRELYNRAAIFRVLIHRCTSGGSEGEFRDLLVKHVHGVLAENDRQDAGTLAAAFFAGGLWRLLRDWLQEEPPRPPEEMAKSVLELMYMGQVFR